MGLMLAGFGGMGGGVGETRGGGGVAGKRAGRTPMGIPVSPEPRSRSMTWEFSCDEGSSGRNSKADCTMS